MRAPYTVRSRMRVAVVDIGTNSTRLLVADVEPRRGGVAELRRESIVTRLGDGRRRDGAARRGAAQARVLAALARYAARDRAQHGATRARGADLRGPRRRERRGVRGGGARAPRTRGAHAHRRRGGGVTYAGATAARPPDDPTERVVIDIGGGSTELVCGSRGRPGFHVSTQIGVVRHSERHLHSDPPTAAELAALAADVDALLAAAVPAAVRARTAGRDRGRRHGDVVRGDRPRRSIPTTPSGRGPRAPARRARGAAGAARGPPARRAARASPGSIPTARRPSSPASSCCSACSSAFGLERGGGVRSRHPLGGRAGARHRAGLTLDRRWDSGRSYDGEFLTPAGYSKRR